MQKLSPVVLFTYIRLENLQNTINALAANIYAIDSELIIFSDGAKYPEDEQKVNEIRSYLKSIVGFKSISIKESEINLGLAKSVIRGVSSVLEKYDHCIVLEDDLIVSSNFLEFMNQGLDYYKNIENVLSICGYSPPIKSTNDIYFTRRSSSWGWATWSNRWKEVDWECKGYDNFKFDLLKKIRFNRMGSDLSLMLKKQMNGQIDSWAIRFSFHQFNRNLYSVHPTISKVVNNGLNEQFATNTVGNLNRFSTILDTGDKLKFDFVEVPQLEAEIIRQFIIPNSIFERLKSKLFQLFR